MEDRDFFDTLFQAWAKTTGAEGTFWMPEAHFDRSGRFNIYAVGEDESRKLVASGLSEDDADFLTALHGCLPDLVRRLHAALDESDSLDYERDDREATIAGLAAEVYQLKQTINGLSKSPPWAAHAS